MADIEQSFKRADELRRQRNKLGKSKHKTSDPAQKHRLSAQYAETTLNLQRAEEETNKILKHEVFRMVKQLHPDCMEKVLASTKILIAFTGERAPPLQHDLSVSKTTFAVRNNLAEENRQLYDIFTDMNGAFTKEKEEVALKLFSGDPVGNTIDDVLAPWRLQQCLRRMENVSEGRACIAAVRKSIERGNPWGQAYAEGHVAGALSAKDKVTRGLQQPS
jgi:hypothetical protein